MADLLFYTFTSYGLCYILMEGKILDFASDKVTKVKLANMGPRELEEHLRDVGVMSSAVAKQTANILYKSYQEQDLLEQRDVVDSINALIDKIKH